MLSSVVCAMEKEKRLAAYNPHREGYTAHYQNDMTPHFKELYEEHKFFILRDLGPEIAEFCEKYSETEHAKRVERYVKAIVVRMAFMQRRGSRKIEVLKTTVPINVAEYCFIMFDQQVPNSDMTSPKILQQKLRQYFEHIKTVAQQINAIQLPKRGRLR